MVEKESAQIVLFAMWFASIQQYSEGIKWNDSFGIWISVREDSSDPNNFFIYTSTNIRTQAYIARWREKGAQLKKKKNNHNYANEEHAPRENTVNRLAEN